MGRGKKHGHPGPWVNTQCLHGRAGITRPQVSAWPPTWHNRSSKWRVHAKIFEDTWNNTSTTRQNLEMSCTMALPWTVTKWRAVTRHLCSDKYGVSTLGKKVLRLVKNTPGAVYWVPSLVGWLCPHCKPCCAHSLERTARGEHQRWHPVLDGYKSLWT